MNKIARQQIVRKLIATGEFRTQRELTESLAAKRIAVTQSSLSRDLVEIGVIKRGGFYALPEATRQTQIFGLERLLAAGENLLVAKCRSGLASAVAVRIDNAGIAEIIGTIAGDDTVFIAIADAQALKNVSKRIWKIFDN